MRTTTRAALALAATATLTVSTAAAAAPGRNNMALDAERTTGDASVFMVNPVQSSGIQTLTDQKDSAAAVPLEEYAGVDLTRLDGSGYLRGDWVTVESSTGKAAYSATGTYLYDRADDRFEQVMAYFWITRAQDYLQGLGFGGPLPGVMDEQIAVKINQLGGDNSYQTDKPFRLRFGKGGVDDAEDAEVIVHEYGHAIQADQVAGFGTSVDARVIGEGFSDYLAVSVGLAVSADEGWTIRDEHPYETDGRDPAWEAEACFADWDATEVSPAPVKCLRRLDQPFTATGRTGDLYRDSMIWSGALWRIRQAYEAQVPGGSAAWDTTLIASQFGYAPDTSFAAAAQAAVDTAAERDGAAAAAAVRAEFVARDILS